MNETVKTYLHTLGEKLVVVVRSALIGKTSTVVRGVMWGFAALSAQLGIAAPPEETGQQLGAYLVSAACALVAMGWSWLKDRYLKQLDPTV